METRLLRVTGSQICDSGEKNWYLSKELKALLKKELICSAAVPSRR
jgi:hypothetical protein